MKPRSPARCLATWLGVTVLTAGALAWVAPDLREVWVHLAAEPGQRGAPGASPLAAWLTRVAATAVGLCALWGWWVTTVVVGQALTGRQRAVPGVPVRARRLVLAACGLLVAGSASPALASGPVADQVARESQRSADPASGPRALHGLPLPDRAVGPSAAQAVARAVVRRAGQTPPEAGVRVPAAPPRPDRRPDRRTRVHVVQEGESLWSIAAAAWTRATGTPPTAAEVAAYWPQVYAVSRDLVGDDPDLVLPGRSVRLPPPLSTARAAAHPAHGSHHGEDPR